MRPGSAHFLPALAALFLLLSACLVEAEPQPYTDDDDAGDLGKADDGSADDPEDCAFDLADPFEPRERLPRGAYRGRCYDTRSARPVIVLDDDRAAPYGGVSDDELVLANVFHDGRFWVARVPIDAVEVVLFQLEYFPAIVPAGHTQMRVRFRDDAPVTLIAQSGPDAGRTTTVQDLVMSVEAIGQPGYRYDLLRGLVNDFGAVYRVTSLAAKVDHMIVQQGHRVEQWALFLEPDETRRLVESFAYESDARRMQTMYNTLFVNCTNEAIRIIDLSVDYTVAEQVGRFLAKITEFYPNIIRPALIARGLLPLDQSSDWPELADDPTIADILDQLGAR